MNPIYLLIIFLLFISFFIFLTFYKKIKNKLNNISFDKINNKLIFFFKKKRNKANKNLKKSKNIPTSN
jgi:hypothetical protein